jgi:aspartate racemase
MKTIGLLGGMSWESTIPYYRIINESVRERLGGLHSAKLVLYSVDFAEIEQLQRDDDWAAAGTLLGEAARRLVAAGAEGLVLCTNTMHRVAVAVEAAVPVPLLHIADPTADAVHRIGARRVGLLGTRFTMEGAFYADRLRERQDLEVLVPDAATRAEVHRIIYEELCVGELHATSREFYRRAIAALVADGAEAVILGCTEISLLVGPGDSPVPLFDTTRIHAQSAADWALGHRG